MSAPPHEIGRHVVLDVVRSEATLDVLRAYDRERRHEVMLVLRDADAPLADAQALANASHPNLVEIYEVGMHEGRAFVAMEAVVGRTLAQWSIAQQGWRDVLAILVAAGDGLAAAHAAGVVHGSFCAASVLVEKSDRVRVTDFFATTSATKADDLEAFAAVAWEAIYGKPPFRVAEPGGAQRELARVDEQRAPRWLHAALVRVLTAASDRPRHAGVARRAPA